MGIASRIELGCSYELGSGRTRIGVLTRPRKRLGMVMTDHVSRVVMRRAKNLTSSHHERG